MEEPKERKLRPYPKDRHVGEATKEEYIKHMKDNNKEDNNKEDKIKEYKEYWKCCLCKKFFTNPREHVNTKHHKDNLRRVIIIR
jgi:hypothetical protein